MTKIKYIEITSYEKLNYKNQDLSNHVIPGSDT